MKIKDILRENYVVSGDAGRDVSGVAYNSRNVKDGDLFVAVRGENFDGHDFIKDAIEKGAAAVVYEKIENRKSKLETLMNKYPDMVWIGVEDSRDALAAIASEFFRRPSEYLTVIGITGTNGKTTTTYLVKSILEKWGKETGLIGTITYLIKDRAYEAQHTTPEALDFQSLLRAMADEGCSHVVAEVSSHALSQKRVDHTRFKVAVFTNLTRDHLDFHHSMEDYFTAKKRLFTELLMEDGVAVVNIDDPYGKRLADALRSQGVKILTCAIKNQDADVKAFDIKTTSKGTSFRLRTLGSELKTLNSEIIESSLLGEINVYNILSAVCTSMALNIPVEIIKYGIAGTSYVKGRFERVELGQDFLAVVDYAHTEDALERLLLTARQLAGEDNFAKDINKVITVFGCGGNRDVGKRPRMGNVAARFSNFVIITSDNPRDEDPRKIIRDIEQGINGNHYIVISDRSIAIRMAVILASKGDIVIVAGKGHEDYQEVRGARHAFSDRTALENAIREVVH
ncbi:MAG: UDP-N-acetylmuramoyl-L-alanyl-D-glutamate--2,6-diaminopimelate ligase [Thermodesulfovibrionales bacterium]|nr:UDP-N-acetylmuramoyl-L-alanyl-D-glutamate--2,6-diaminopimelate ligase [Thermodesulfovibrionales bacterium]